MKKQTLITLTILLFTGFTQLHAQKKRNDTNTRKFFVGSTFAMLGNFSKSNKPEFAQLNFGYRITPKDVVSLELKTWKYAWSLGIPLGPEFEAPELEFPGYIRENGFAFVYQRFWWKGLYTGLHVMNAWQGFVDTSGNKIDDGFQIFNTYRLGYQIKLFKNRAFIEPSIAITHRPFHTEMPEGFKVIDDQYPKLFYGEPGLHFGFNF